MLIREGKKTSVIIIAPGEMPSVNLATTLPLSYKVNPFKYNLIYSNYLHLISSFINNLSLAANSFWVIRECSLYSIFALSKLKGENNNFIYEFDDRFDKLPLSTDKKYNSSNAALVARFYWMLDNASALRVYSKTIVEDLPEHVQTKTKICKQYSPVIVPKKQIEKLWKSSVLRIAVLTTRSSDPDILAGYNKILHKIKSSFGSRVETISFDKRIDADKFIKPIHNIEKYYNKIRELDLHFTIALSEEHDAFKYKTPNKFREAAGFGYICAVTKSAVFDEVPKDLFISSKDVNELEETLLKSIANPKAAEKMAIKAHEYARQTYDIKNVSKETTEMIIDTVSELKDINFTNIDLHEKLYISPEDKKNKLIMDSYLILMDNFSTTRKLNKSDIVISSKEVNHKYSIILTEQDNNIKLRLYNYDKCISECISNKTKFDHFSKLIDVSCELISLIKNNNKYSQNILMTFSKALIKISKNFTLSLSRAFVKVNLNILNTIRRLIRMTLNKLFYIYTHIANLLFVIKSVIIIKYFNDR